MKNLNLKFLLILFLLLGCDASSKVQENQIKIGAVASLTGAAGEQGNNWLQGVTLAVEDAKLKGINVKLFVEDDQTQPAVVVSGFTKLVQANKVNAIIGGTWDYLAEAAYPLAKRYQVPFITPTNPVEIISSDAMTSGYVYSNAITLQSQGQVTKKFIIDKNIESIGIVYPDLPFGTRQSDLVKEIAEELNLDVLFEYAFPPSSLMSDTVKLAAQKILMTKPDLTFMVIDYNGLDLFTRECSLLKISPLVLTTQHLDQAFIFSKAPERYKNLYGIYPVPAPDEFSKRFAAKFNTEPKVYAQEGYAAAEALIELLRNRTTFSGEKIFLNTILGKYEVPNETRLLGTGEVQIMTTTNGIFEQLS